MKLTNIKNLEYINKMDDSSFYLFDNGIYYITSYKAKNDIYHMSSVIYFNLVFDLTTILFYSAFYREFLVTLPFIIIGFYGNRKYNTILLYIYQFHIIISIIINIYLSSIANFLWLKVGYIINTPITFWYLYTIWYYTIKIRGLNKNDKNRLINGWTPDEFI
jgi:hypothetical protein